MRRKEVRDERRSNHTHAHTQASPADLSDRAMVVQKRMGKSGGSYEVGIGVTESILAGKAEILATAKALDRGGDAT